MKQKPVKYFLIAGVMLIWGIIIYRVLNGLQKDDAVPVVKKKSRPVKYNIEKDSFALLANYPDPFLAGQENRPENTSQLIVDPGPASVVSSVIKTTRNEPTADINSIIYHGMIANPGKKKKLAMLSIAGKEYLAREKEKIEGIRVQKIEMNEVTIIANGEVIYISRKGN